MDPLLLYPLRLAAGAFCLWLCVYILCVAVVAANEAVHALYRGWRDRQRREVEEWESPIFSAYDDRYHAWVPQHVGIVSSGKIGLTDPEGACSHVLRVESGPLFMTATYSEPAQTWAFTLDEPDAPEGGA